VNIRDLNEVEEVLHRIRITKKPQPYVPLEYTYEGFLEVKHIGDSRVNFP